MKPVFADTSFFLALISQRDQYHRSALDISLRLTVPLITTAWIVLEFANAISARQIRERFERFFVRLRSESDATIIAPDSGLFDSGCELYISRTDKDWSLTDCISFVVMQREGLTDALTSDHHYQQAGFRALLLE